MDVSRVLVGTVTDAPATGFYLDALTLDDMHAVCEWRRPRSVRAGLRTPYPLTEEQQDAFYREVVCNRNAPHRYMAMRLRKATTPDSITHDPFMSMVGLVGIQWENGVAEISLIVRPGGPKGTGRAAVALTLDWAFNDLRLETVWGECYQSNAAVGFWEKIVAAHPGGSAVIVPGRKWWAGRMWGSYIFTLPKPSLPGGQAIMAQQEKA